MTSVVSAALTAAALLFLAGLLSGPAPAQLNNARPWAALLFALGILLFLAALFLAADWPVDEADVFLTTSVSAAIVAALLATIHHRRNKQ